MVSICFFNHNIIDDDVLILLMAMLGYIKKALLVFLTETGKQLAIK